MAATATPIASPSRARARVGGRLEPAVGREIGPDLLVGGRVEPVADRHGHAGRAGRRNGERPAQSRRSIDGGVEDRPADIGVFDGLVPCPSRGRHVVIGDGVLPGQHDPDGQRVRTRVLDPPLEDADRKRARVEVAGDDRAELLADEAHAKGVRLERLPGARKECVVRAGALGERPAPGRQRLGAERGQDSRRPVAARTPDEDGEAIGRHGREGVLADLEVPAREVATVRPPDAPRAETADRDPGIGAVVDHRQVDARVAGLGAGQAHRTLPGDARDLRPGPLVGHLSTPVTTTPRMNARWARKNTTTGTAIVISAVAWISVGWVE